MDELLAQYDESRRASWPLQDAGGDIIALCDLGGAYTGHSSGAARVTWQATYDPYGKVISTETLATHAELHCGHKGLFFDRLDAGVEDSGGAEMPRLAAASVILGENRNRTLMTEWGRFLQSDPNDTGFALVDGPAFHGCEMEPANGEFDLYGHFGGGTNTLAYLRGTPLSSVDPLGLLDFTMVGVLFASSTAEGLQTDWSQDIADAGQTIGTTGMDLMNVAALDEINSFDWASDWSRADDDYAGAAVIPQGSIGGGGGDGPAMAAMGSGIAKGIRHHIMTVANSKYGRTFTLKFYQALRKGGLKPKEFMASAANILRLTEEAAMKAHAKVAGGGYHHAEKYHAWVLEAVDEAVKVAKSKGLDVAEELTKTLRGIGDRILTEPEILWRGP